MDRMEAVAEILKKEYGISTAGELQAALLKLETIDVSLFCAEMPKKKEKAS